MKVSILCHSPTHPVTYYLKQWVHRNSDKHKVNLFYEKGELPGGDVLFLISCSDIIGLEYRNKYKKTLVIHASDLPQGRGWSPHIWQLIEGAEKLTLTLLEAEDKVDCGNIWQQKIIHMPVNALWNEINEHLFAVELSLMDYALDNFYNIKSKKQANGNTAAYYSKRLPADSEIDPSKSLLDQFNLIRVCDPERFPAFFRLHGHRYKIVLEKMDEE